MFHIQSRPYLNVCHINVQSIPSYYDDFIDSFSDSNVHAVLVSKTWLKPYLLSTSYARPDFVFIRNDRFNRRGGGVAVYLRNFLPHKSVASSSSDFTASAEFLVLQVCVKGVNVILGVAY